jgi:hypothetical protein
MLVLVLLAFLLMFTLTQAGYWIYRSHLQRNSQALRERLSLFEDRQMAPLLKPQQRWVKLTALIEQAGFRYGVEGFFVRATAFSLLLSIPALSLSGPELVPLCLMGGPLLAYVRLVGARHKRLTKIALEVLVLTLRSGQALPRAMAAVAEEVSDPLRSELRRLVEEHQLGRPLDEAFRALEERLAGSMPVRLLVTSVLVLGQTGGGAVPAAASRRHLRRSNLGRAHRGHAVHRLRVSNLERREDAPSAARHADGAHDPLDRGDALDHGDLLGAADLAARARGQVGRCLRPSSRSAAPPPRRSSWRRAPSARGARPREGSERRGGSCSRA